MTKAVRQDQGQDQRRSRTLRAAALCAVVAVVGAGSGCPGKADSPPPSDSPSAQGVAPGQLDSIPWTGSVADPANRNQVLAYARALRWDRQHGDSAVVNPPTNAVAVIEPNRNGRKYNASEIGKGRFIARIRPRSGGNYDRLGIVAGDTNHIYVWVVVLDTTKTGPATLIFESPKPAKEMRVYPRPRSSGPHKSFLGSDTSYASWTELTNAKLGADAGLDLRRFGLSRATLQWLASTRLPTTPLPLAVIRPPVWRQAFEAIPWADCSEYCCVVNN